MNDQIAHVFFGWFLVCGLFMVPTFGGGAIVAGAIVGLTYGGVREVTQMMAVNDLTLGLRRIIDLFFWGVGGALGGYTCGI